jgi:hypothetical protein
VGENGVALNSLRLEIIIEEHFQKLLLSSPPSKAVGRMGLSGFKRGSTEKVAGLIQRISHA